MRASAVGGCHGTVPVSPVRIAGAAINLCWDTLLVHARRNMTLWVNNNWGGDPLRPNFGGDPAYVQNEMLEVNSVWRPWVAIHIIMGCTCTV